MKKLATFLLFTTMVLTSCSSDTNAISSQSKTSQVSSPSSAQNSLENSVAESINESNSSQHEEVFDVFLESKSRALPVMFWYMGDDTEDLQIASESIDGTYYKVGRFNSIEEMKAATTEVFTQEYAEVFFYDHAFVETLGQDMPMYKEIDGALYRNLGAGGIGWPYGDTQDYVISYQDDNTRIINYKSTLFDSEEEWTYFVMKNQDGIWKFDTYYDFNPYLRDTNMFSVDISTELSAAVSSWLCTSDWSNPNELSFNSLINFYLYTNLNNPQLDYDFSVGYPVSGELVFDTLSQSFSGLEKQTITTMNEDSYGNARYDESTDTFYFDISFDPASYLVVGSQVQPDQSVVLEIMLMDINQQVYGTSYLTVLPGENHLKFLGNVVGNSLTQ